MMTRRERRCLGWWLVILTAIVTYGVIYTTIRQGFM